jgi:RNA-directed DNA polymerase
MTKASINLQDLRRRLYVKAEAEPTSRFWGCRSTFRNERPFGSLSAGKSNDGTPGMDGVTFEVIEAEGVEGFLERLREELVERRYWPQFPRL